MSARMGRAGQRGAVTQCYGNIYNFYEYSQLPRVMSLGQAVLARDRDEGSRRFDNHGKSALSRHYAKYLSKN